MNCIAYESVGIVEFTAKREGEAKCLRPDAMPNDQASLGDRVARRAAEVLNFELAQGAMPA
ncbi:MAG: hypothetical protein WA172_03015 [Terriglobales bacterium]